MNFESRFCSFTWYAQCLNTLKEYQRHDLKWKKKDSATHKFYSQSHWFSDTRRLLYAQAQQFALFPSSAQFLIWQKLFFREKTKGNKNIKTKTFKMKTEKMFVFKWIFLLVFIRCRCRIQYFIFYQRHAYSCADFTTFYVLFVCVFSFASSFTSSSRTKPYHILFLLIKYWIITVSTLGKMFRLLRNSGKIASR